LNVPGESGVFGAKCGGVGAGNGNVSERAPSDRDEEIGGKGEDIPT